MSKQFKIIRIKLLNKNNRLVSFFVDAIIFTFKLSDKALIRCVFEDFLYFSNVYNVKIFNEKIINNEGYF